VDFIEFEFDSGEQEGCDFYIGSEKKNVQWRNWNGMVDVMPDYKRRVTKLVGHLEFTDAEERGRIG
jgi:hypothetical protein